MIFVKSVGAEPLPNRTRSAPGGSGAMGRLRFCGGY